MIRQETLILLLISFLAGETGGRNESIGDDVSGSGSTRMNEPEAPRLKVSTK